MTATKHTAPPWELKALVGMGGPQAIIKKLPGGIDRFICLFLRSNGLTAEEQLANAKLIARGPDLLRCLDQVNNAFYRVGQDPAGVMRVNEHDIYQLRFLLRELGSKSL
jgi:hypothetical protein